MSEKNEALRLADALMEEHPFPRDIRLAADELRRLHELLKEWEAKAATWLASPEAAQRLEGYRELAQRLEKAEAQRDALLEALKEIVAATDSDEWNPVSTIKARAAIKAVADGK